MTLRINTGDGAVRQFNVEAKKLTVFENRGLSRYWWGHNDQAPQELLSVIQQSGTAMLCVGKIHDYTISKGFKVEALNKMKVNSEENAYSVLSKAAYDAAIFKAVCFRVLYNAKGAPGMIYSIPLRHIRKNLDGSFTYNKRMYEQYYNRGEDVRMEKFNPGISPDQRAHIIAEDIKNNNRQIGEIIFLFEETPFLFGEVYPIPTAYAGLEDIMTDAKIQDIESMKADGKYNSDIIISRIKSQTNNLLPPSAPIDGTENEPGLPNSEEDFDNAILDFQEGVSKVLDLTAESKEGMPNVNSFNEESFQALDTASDRVSRKVCRLLETPPVVVGFDVATILGNSEAMSNALKAFNLTITPRKALIELAFSMVYPGQDWELTTNNLFQFLPDKVLAELSSEELRSYGGVPAVDDSKLTEQDKLLKILKSLEPAAAGKLIDKMDSNTVGILLGVKQEVPSVTV